MSQTLWAVVIAAALFVSGFTISAGNKCIRDSDGVEVAWSNCEPE